MIATYGFIHMQLPTFHKVKNGTITDTFWDNNMYAFTWKIEIYKCSSLKIRSKIPRHSKNRARQQPKVGTVLAIPGRLATMWFHASADVDATEDL